jgi:hypothetical protein
VRLNGVALSWLIHEGRTNFSELQAEVAAGKQDRLIYYAFDLLWRDGDLRKLPQTIASNFAHYFSFRTPLNFLALFLTAICPGNHRFDRPVCRMCAGESVIFAEQAALNRW